MQFLSEEWFRTLNEKIQQAGDLEIEPDLDELILNLTVTECAGAEATRDIRLEHGLICKGHHPAAVARVTLPAESARKLLVEWDQTAGITAMLSGKLKVDGSPLKLMALRTIELSDRHLQVLEEVDALTT